MVTDELYRTWDEAPEGTLAKARAAIVSSENLAEQAAGYSLGDHLALGKGEDQSGGREKPSILADAMEAVIGAVYLDGGMEAARQFVLDAVGSGLEEAVTGALVEQLGHAAAHEPTQARSEGKHAHAVIFGVWHNLGAAINVKHLL